METEGQRNSSNPSAMLASLLGKREKLQEELRSIERQMSNNHHWMNIPQLNKDFIDLCLTQIGTCGYQGTSLKPYSWQIIRETLSATYPDVFNQVGDKQKFIKNRWNRLKKKFTAYRLCMNIIGNVYNETTGQFTFTDEQWKTLYKVYELETSYLQDSSQCGNVLKGFEGFLSSSKSTTNLKRSRKFQPEDRLFSLSSVTSPAVEEHIGRDDGRSDFGQGRSKGGGTPANGQGKPKKGGRTAPRDVKRFRQSSEQDMDDEDDPDLSLR